MRISLAVLAVALCAAAPAPRKGATMDWKQQSGGPAEPAQLVIADAKAWAELWKKLGAPAPALDFKTHAAVAVLLGERPTGGWGIELLEKVDGDDLVVRWTVVEPRGFVTQAFTNPWRVKAYPRPKGKLRLEPAK